MKTKIKQHYRSVVSVLLSVCMLVSCMTVGLIATDAARVTDNDEVAASVDTIDEVAAAAESDDAVGASADTEESVGSGAGYILKSDNDKPSHAGDTGVTVTKSGNNYTATLPIALFEINRNYYIMLSSSTSYSNSFFQNSNITVSKANGSTQISGCGSQSRDQYRMARFSLSTKDGISGIKVVVSGTSKTYTLSTVSSATTTYSVTVNAGANGSVVAGSTAITAGNSATVSVAQGSNISLVATPVQGYSFKEWRTVSGNCSVASPTSASTTLSATANGGTVTATYIKNATAKRRIYYDNSSTNWTTPYAYAELSDDGQFEAFKRQLIEEINALHVEGMPEVKRLNALVGRYINLAYPLPNGASVKLLDDQTTYLGNQLESGLGGERCFGVVANMDFILVSTYEKDGVNPELVLYKKR